MATPADAAESRPHHHSRPLSAHTDEKEVSVRAAAAVIGAFTADCASLGLHWIYDQKKIAEIVKKEGRATFLEPHYAQWHVKKRVRAWAARARWRGGGEAHGARGDGALA